LPAPVINGGGENESGRISDFQGLVSRDLDLGSGHTAYCMHHSLTSTFIPNLVEIEDSFCGRTDVWTGIWNPLY